MKFLAYVALAAMSLSLAGCACAPRRMACPAPAPMCAPPMVKCIEK